MHFLKGIDKTLLFLALFAVSIGLLVVASSTASLDEPNRYILMQIGAFILGFLILLFMQFIDYENIGYLAKYFYGIIIVLLVAVLFFGYDADTNTSRWIKLGFFSFQPAEIVKILFIITLAKHISTVINDVNYIKNIGFLALHAFIPIALIILQPDMGTALSFAFVFIVMLFIAGVNWRYFAFSFGGIAALSPMIYFFVLKDYQKARILEFLNPEADPTGSSYQLIQSKIAIGSGGLFGNGLFSGLQTQGGLLPAKHTDFIFGVVGEELGFIGSILLVLILFAIIARCIFLSIRSKSIFGKMICIGVAALLAFHIFENLLMVVGLAPITGIPLPFISYGGTSMLATMVEIGLVLLVSRK